MSITVVDTVKYAGTDGALDFYLTIPNTVADGDWLIVMTVGAGSASAQPVATDGGTIGGGLTEVGTVANTPGFSSMVWKRKLLAADSGKTVDITMASTSLAMAAMGVIVRGGDPTDIVDAFAKSAPVSHQGSWTTPTVTAQSAGCAELSFMAITEYTNYGVLPSDADGTVTSPVTRIDAARTNDSSNNDSWAGVAFNGGPIAESASVGGETWDFGTKGGKMGAWTLVLKPAPAPTAPGSGTASGAFLFDGTATGQREHYGSAVEGHPNVDDLLAQDTFYCAHRGGSADWLEMTLSAYSHAAAWNPDLAMEISVWQTSDGVYVGSHDQTTSGVYPGTSYDITETPWATIEKLGIVKLTDILDRHARTRTLFVENKGDQNNDDFLDILDSYGGPDWFIVKAYGAYATEISTKAGNRGYRRWGYYFANTMDMFATSKDRWDLYGLAWDDSQANWDEALAEGKPVMGHICATATQAQTAIGKGADGIMASGVMEIVPQVSATTPLFTWTGTAAGVAAAESTSGGDPVQDADPGNLAYGKITGRFAIVTADGTDADRNPDFSPATDVKVTFTPTAGYILDASAETPATIVPKPIPCTTDDEGFLIDPQGNRGVFLLATDDEDMNPVDWTWSVSITGLDATIREFDIDVPAGSSRDLSVITPVASSAGEAVIRGPAGEGIPPTDDASTGDVVMFDGNEAVWSSVAGGGATQLLALTDVNADSISSGQMIVWDGTEFVPGNPGVTTLGNLDDVDTTGVADGDALVYNIATESWTTAAVGTSGGGGGATTLNELDDVDVSGAASGAALVFDGNDWVPGHVTVDAGEVTSLADVAMSGDYSDLLNVPSIPTTPEDIGAAAESELSTVAKTGAYTDLAGRPTIPQTAADVGARPDTWLPLASDIGALTLNDVATVATSGSYDDLADQPFIPATAEDLGAVVESDLADVAISGEYSDLLNPPAIPDSADDVGAVPGYVDDVNFVAGNITSSFVNGQYNTSVGRAVEPGDYSSTVAIGDSAIIGGDNSIGIGADSNTYNNGAVAVGQASGAGLLSVAVGWQAAAYLPTDPNNNIAAYNIAIGPQAKAAYGSTIAIGHDVTASAMGSIAIGGDSPTENLAVIGTSDHSLSVGDPGNGAGAWKFGTKQAATVTLDTTGYIEVEIDGTVYKLALAQ